MVLNYLLTHNMVVINCQRRHAWHEAIVFFVSWPLYLYLIGNYGARGAALGLVFAELTLLVLTAGFLFLRLGARFADEREPKGAL